MQTEILREVDNLKLEVNEGRKKINEEIERSKQMREENFEQLRLDFAKIREQIEKEVANIRS